jgi:L-amino acid N-acyltransferase YncA
LVDDNIVADGALELSGVGWKEHMAELRLIIAPDYQRKGLGTLMARELYTLASSANVEELVVRMMRPQVAARSIFEKLGFKEMATIPDYVKDVKGQKQDMILMRCDLAGLWRELEQQLADSDWRRMR